MLDFSDLVGAVQASVQSASDLLARESYASFRQYFVDVKEPEDARKILQEALREAETLAGAKQPKEMVKRLAESLEVASAALDAGTRALQPKLVAIDYPTMTSTGPAVHTVHVPLITLSPYVATQVSKLTFKADLEVQVTSEGKLKVSFPPPPSSSPPTGAGAAGGAAGEEACACRKTTNTSIEIVVEATPASDGLRKVIEGYERALRAQIPG
jgi:Protein of unknown function (DUF2589)